VGTRASERKSLGSHQHTQFSHLKTREVLSRNLRQTMPKMRIFEKKAVESPQRPEPPLASGGSPQTPALLLSPTNVAFVECVSIIERTLFLRKITEVTHSKCFG